jgi:hypothetical protein
VQLVAFHNSHFVCVFKTATLRTASTHIQFSNDKRVLVLNPLCITTAPNIPSPPELEELPLKEKTRSIDRTVDVGSTVTSSVKQFAKQYQQSAMLHSAF